MMTEEGLYYLVVGLGNPGREYRDTRHNIGFMAVDQIAKALNVRLMKVQSKAIMGIAAFEGKKIVLAKPQTYMNLSGQSVSGLLRFYKIPIQQMIVVHDDLDLPLGTLRMRPAGGSAGQKGLGSIIQQLATQDFPRLRLGIGRPPGRMDAADYVLQDFAANEQEVLKAVFDQSVQAVQTFIQYGLERAMNQFNGNINKE
jgi:PTH1 family peptidyl-tRNA hydrolase